MNFFGFTCVIDLLYDILEAHIVHLQGESLDCVDVEVVRKNG